MDVIFNNFGLFVNVFGYGWCGGCRIKWFGEDFRCEGDIWKFNY